MIAWLTRIKIELTHDTRRRLLRCTRQYSTRVRVADLLNTVPDEATGKVVNLAGWIRTIRKQKRVAFASVQDGSTIQPVQVVLRPEQASPLSTGAAVVIKGRWVAANGGSQQAFELHAEDVNLQGDNDASTYPIQKKYHTAEFLRTLPHLRVRTPYNSLLLRLRSEMIAAATAFFNQAGFIQTHTPLITSSDCEGAGEVFTVDANQARRVGKIKPGPMEQDIGPFFGDAKYLTVSGQLHLEALAQSVGSVWTLSPTFRAEKSDTARHLSEFYMLEAEVAFADDVKHITDVVERLVRHMAKSLMASRLGNELLDLSRNAAMREEIPPDALPLDAGILTERWESLCRESWPRLTFGEACTVLKNAHSDGKVHFTVLPDDTAGLQTEHERYLADVVYNGPVFVTDYPQAVKPFYMAPSTTTTELSSRVPTVACFDLLLPDVCEVVGGSLREHRLKPLMERMHEQGLSQPSDTPGSESSLDWYLDLRRYGSVPHGGFGLGFDRLLGFLAGVRNIRDTVTFPRYYKRSLC